MMRRPSVALIIATYNWPEALQLVLQSVLLQKILPDEVIIADDGSGIETEKLINNFKTKFPVPLKHFWHEDNGFQKTIILNRAVAGTNCDYIIQIDGDIVLNKYFIADHLKAAEKGFYIRGSRVLLMEERSFHELDAKQFSNISSFSLGIKNRINAFRIPFLAPLFTKKAKRSNNVSGCNCAFWRHDFVRVNGYNTEIKGWGHEDIELAARFINAGLLQKKIKMIAVCYHLYHSLVDRKTEHTNYKIYQRTLAKGVWYCAKGYHNHRKHFPDLQHSISLQESISK